MYYGSYLANDYRRLCYHWNGEIDPMYRSYLYYCYAMIIVFPIGTTLMYTMLLWRVRRTIDPGQKELVFLLGSEEKALAVAIEIRDKGPHRHEHKRLAFLYEEYEPGRWWFEVFECFRRLILTAGVLVSDKSIP